MKARLTIAGLGAAGLLAGCGQSTSTVHTGTGSTSPTVDTVGCSSGTASLTVGQQLRVSGCGPGTRAGVTGSALTATGAYGFRAVRTGTATIDLAQGPVCSSGQTCPQYRTYAGKIVVTVR